MRNAELVQWQGKHVNVNQTFILLANRLLNKVNVTVIERRKASIYVPPEATGDTAKISAEKGGCPSA